MLREHVKKYKRNLEGHDGDTSLNFSEKVLVGGISGIINGICTLPFDTIKTNVQKSGFIDNASLKNIYNIGKKLIKTHGIQAGLYPAFHVKFIHYLMVGIITADIIERVDKIWEDRPHHISSPKL